MNRPSSVSVLLVEDNEMNRNMLSRRLIKNGYSVRLAVNGEEAVSMAASGHPDIILMDLSLPLMDGWEATKILKGNDETKRIPVIALTAHALLSDKQKALEAGCDDYDTKPIDLDRLLKKIKTQLSK